MDAEYFSGPSLGGSDINWIRATAKEAWILVIKDRPQILLELEVNLRELIRLCIWLKNLENL